MNGIIAVKVLIPVRRAVLGEQALFSIFRVTFDQVVLIGQAYRRSDQDLALRVNRHRAPVKHPDIAREEDRTAFGRWRPRVTVVAQGFKVDAAGHLVERRNAPH